MKINSGIGKQYYISLIAINVMYIDNIEDNAYSYVLYNHALA